MDHLGLPVRQLLNKPNTVLKNVDYVSRMHMSFIKYDLVPLFLTIQGTWFDKH